MSEHTAHWTESDVEAFVYRIAFDFVTYVKDLGDRENVSQADLAKRLGVTEGRVSQILNNPGNLTLKMIVKVARALERKVSVVGYDDGDAKNERGPVNAKVFAECWELMGKPADSFGVQDARARMEASVHVVTVNDTLQLNAWTKRTHDVILSNSGNAVDVLSNWSRGVEGRDKLLFDRFYPWHEEPDKTLEHC
jgi:transcriptional regulator with XRE-family HTH domain